MTPDPAELYDSHAQALYAFALNLTRSEAEAKDILQEIFARIAARPELIAHARSPRHFLLRMAHRAVVDAYRRTESRVRCATRLAEEESGRFAPTEDPDLAVFRQALTTALDRLPAEQRAVVHLKLWEDLTFAEIAEALDIPPNTTASRYRYGLEKLQSDLRPIYRELATSNPCPL